MNSTQRCWKPPDTHTAERGAELLSRLKQVRYLNFQKHADERILEREGITEAVVADMVLRPYGKIYYHRFEETYAIHAPEIVPITGKSRAVIIAIYNETAFVITAYNVDEPQKYADSDYYRFLADCRYRVALDLQTEYAWVATADNGAKTDDPVEYRSRDYS